MAGFGEKIATALGSAGVGGAGFAINILWPDVFPQFVTAIFAVSVICLFISGCIWVWILWSWWRAKKASKAEEKMKPEFISLRDAATSLYEKSLAGSKILALAAERLSGPQLNPGSPNERLDYIATHISRYVTIYGKKAPSRNLAEISDQELKGASFDDGAMFLRHKFYDKTIFWADLSVRSSEFDSKIDQLMMDQKSS